MIVTKALAIVTGGDATDEHPNGSFDVILSAPTQDRDGEIIDPGAFDPLPDHVPFDIDHGMSVTTTVGSGRPFYAADGTLRVTGGFASTPLAQEVRSLVNEGHIRTTSVTFMAADRQKDEKGVPHVRSAELLNGTFTPVPSNRQAVVLSSKTLAVIEKAGARNNATDSERLQSIHDLSVANGASCPMKTAAYEAMSAKGWISPAEAGRIFQVADGKDATDVGQLAQAVDAPLDEMDDLLSGVDVTAWPAEAQQAVALAQAASAAVDDLLDALGVADADEGSTDDTGPVESRSTSTDIDASVPDASDVAADNALEFRYRLAVTQNALRFALGE